MQSIDAIVYSDELFEGFAFLDTDYGYDVWLYDGTNFGAFPNHLVMPGDTCFVVNKQGKGLLCQLLGCALTESTPPDELLILRVVDSRTVFCCTKRDLKAIHNATGDFDIDWQAFADLSEAGLTNTVFTYSHGQSWRPWQSLLN